MTRERGGRTGENSDGDHHYLTDEYREKLMDLVADNPDIAQPDVEERFIEKCKEMDRFLKEETPKTAIRRLVFSTLQAEL